MDYYRSQIRLVCQISVINTCNGRVWMSQPRYLFCSAGFPSPASLQSKRGSLLRGSEVWIGQNMVWISRSSTFLVYYIQVGNQWWVLWCRQLIRPLYIPFPWITLLVYLSSLMELILVGINPWRSKCMCGYWSSYISHDVSMMRSILISISSSLIVLYSASASVVPNRIRWQIKSIFSSISMHVDAIF